MLELLEMFESFLEVYCWNLCSSRVDSGVTHEDKIPFQAIDSTFITLVQNERDFLLNKWSKGVNQLRTQARVRVCDLRVWCVKVVYMSYAQTILLKFEHFVRCFR